jgi:outer membrane protein OmpA-like peptidoglycan-associated protein
MMRLVSAGLVALTVAASAALADPAPQYSAQDLERSLARPAAADAPPPAAPAAGECEKRGMVTGEDGVCQPVKNERGFSLPTRASMAAGAPKTPPAAFSLPSRANSAGGGARPAPVGPAPHRDLLITFKSGSFDLTPQAQANASVFAQALSSPVLAGGKFEIAGYTDSVGSPRL